MHTHLGHDKDGTSYQADELLNSMDHSGIGLAVVFPLDEKNGDLIGASKALLSLGNPRLIPFLRFDPKSASQETIRELLPKFRGVKLHPRAQDFDPVEEKYFPFYKLIEESKRPLLIHTRLRGGNPNADPVRISSLAQHFPKLNIIMAHFVELSEEAFDAIKKNDNLYTDTSIQSETNVKIAKFARQVGAEKILFGSDAPYSDQEIEALKVKKASLSEGEKEKILYGNAASILNIKA